MRKAFVALVVAGAMIPILAACQKQQDPQPQQGVYPQQGYPPQQYPTAQQYPPQQYPPQQYPPPAQTAPPPAATQPASPFPFPIPSALPGMIPSGLIPGWPAPAPT